jgi:hypothetical protein
VGAPTTSSETGGIAAEALERRIVEGVDQLGITVTWDPS